MVWVEYIQHEEYNVMHTKHKKVFRIEFAPEFAPELQLPIVHSCIGPVTGASLKKAPILKTVQYGE